MKRTALTTALLALLATLALPAVAGAAKNSQVFMGLNPGGFTSANQDTGLKAMRKRGAGTVRVTFYWRLIQPSSASSFDWAAADAFVASATRQGLVVLPVIHGTPAWASTDPSKAYAPPTDTSTYGRFAGQVAARYGPGGAFWAQNPSLPVKPIRYWQIWNEPAGFLGFGDRSFGWEGDLSTAKTVYKAMLKSARTEIRKVDKGAKIVLAGFYGQAWRTMKQAYGAGYRKLFDVAAIHPYAKNPSDVVKLIRKVRSAMVKGSDKKKPLMITEFGWSSSLGKLTDQSLGLGYIEKNEKGQASAVKSIYRTLYAERKKLRLLAAYWFTWATDEKLTDNPFDWVGLYRANADGSFTAKPAAKAYQKVAKSLRKAR
jgi:hypothetical protein